MNKKLFLSVMLVGILALSFLCVSCGGSSLTGTWEDQSDNSTLELSKDGTGSWGGYAITWKIENKQLKIAGMGMAFSYEYKLSGSTLTLTGVSGDDETYVLKRK